MAAEEWRRRPSERLRFPGQLPNERVYLLQRRYWFVLLQRGWAPVAVCVLLAAGALAATELAAFVGRPLSAPTSGLVWVLFLLPGCTWAAWRVLDWRNDWFIVTDRRVIHVDEIPLIRLRRDEAPLEMIQDVTAHMRGLWQNLLDFGDVENQTAGTLGTVRFTGIRKPRKVQAQIQALMGGARRRDAAPPEDKRVRDIREFLGLPPREETPVPPDAEDLRWESDTHRRDQLGLMLRRLFLAEPEFGENQIVWRKHWWVLLGDLLQPVFIVCSLVAVLWLASGTAWEYTRWIDGLFGLMLGGALIWVAWQALDWHNDVYVVTDERVVDIEKVPLLAEERREARLDRIQDVRYDQPTIIHRIFDFGHVWLETAGEIGRFTFDYVPHPREVQGEIFRRLDAYRRRGEHRQREVSREAFLELLGLYHERTRR
jgi:hypothetical protein